MNTGIKIQKPRNNSYSMNPNKTKNIFLNFNKKCLDNSLLKNRYLISIQKNLLLLNIMQDNI